MCLIYCKVLKIGTPENVAVIVLKFEHCSFPMQ